MTKPFAKLMSYNQIDFQSKFHMDAMVQQMESVNEQMGHKFKEAGVLSFTVTQIWNKQGKFRLGVYYGYRDEKAFIDCQKLLNGIPGRGGPGTQGSRAVRGGIERLLSGLLAEVEPSARAREDLLKL